MLFASIAVSPVGVVAEADKPLAAVSGISEAVGARPEDGLVVRVGAPVELVEVVAVLLVGEGALPRFAVRLVVVIERGRGLALQGWQSASGAVSGAVSAGAGQRGRRVVVVVVIVKIGPFLGRQLGLIGAAGGRGPVEVATNPLSKDNSAGSYESKR